MILAGSNLKILASILLFVFCVGCMPNKADVSECKSVQHWLNLTKEQYEQCIENPDVRAGFIHNRDELMALLDFELFQKNKHILSISENQKFTLIDSVRLLPDTISLDEEAHQKDLYYRVTVQLASDTYLSESGKLTITITDEGNKDPDKPYRFVESNYLNNHQKSFLKNTCWNVDGDTTSSLCRGDAFLRQTLDPEGLGVNLELVGVNFFSADLKKVTNAYTRR